MNGSSPPHHPTPLAPGSHLRVVAPARSLAIIGEDTAAVAQRRMAELGFTVSFGEHVRECDGYASSPVEHRVADLHAAFADPGVDGILTVIGGYSSNELLPHLDWDLIGANPKVVCGFSDITALQLAMWHRTGLVSFSGPHWSTFGMEHHFDATLEWFRAACCGAAPIELRPSSTWSDDLWFLDQDDRRIEPNDGWWPIRRGSGAGTLVGGNLATMSLLFGTPWMPDLAGCVVWVEDDLESPPPTFRRNLVALSHQAGADRIAALLVGRFPRSVPMTRDLLTDALGATAFPEVPVLANLDVGHTDPLATLPLGARAAVEVGDSDADSTVVLR